MPRSAVNRITVSRAKVPLLQPLRHKRFRELCIANFVSNIGTWMQSFAGTWLVAIVSAAPSTTALMQAAMNAPIFLFAMLGGVLADRIDKPRFLFYVHTQMALAASAMAGYVFVGGRAVPVIVGLTFLLGVGAALRVPAWQASMSALVEPHEIPSAATLNGLSFNLASVIGPGIGGLVFNHVSASALFLANALSFVALLVLYWQWWHSDLEVTVSGQALLATLRDGLAAALSSPQFRGLLGRAMLLLSGTTAFASLLPLFVRDVLQMQSSAYGALMGTLGLGAVAGAFLLPTLRARFESTSIVCVAAAIYGLVLVSMGMLKCLPLLVGAVGIAGAAWAAILSSLNAAAQSAFGVEVRARALSLFFVTNALALALGSAGWGYLANCLGVPTALCVAGAFLILNAAFAHHSRGADRGAASSAAS
jgi:predicted MFS family arabinose efflux permease